MNELIVDLATVEIELLSRCANDTLLEVVYVHCMRNDHPKTYVKFSAMNQ